MTGAVLFLRPSGRGADQAARPPGGLSLRRSSTVGVAGDLVPSDHGDATGLHEPSSPPSPVLTAPIPAWSSSWCIVAESGRNRSLSIETLGPGETHASPPRFFRAGPRCEIGEGGTSRFGLGRPYRSRLGPSLGSSGGLGSSRRGHHSPRTATVAARELREMKLAVCAGWRRPSLRRTTRSPRCRGRDRRRTTLIYGHPARRRGLRRGRCAHAAPGAPGHRPHARAARSGPSPQ